MFYNYENYVNEDKFIEWYKSVAKEPRLSSEALLADVFQCRISTRETAYRIPAEKTVTGREESYFFRFENIGACGACTNYIYF